MPGAQPLNSEISIYRSARTQRVRYGTDAVAVLIKHLRSLVVVVPGHEIMCGVLTRDTANKDFSPYCGQAAAGATRGMPLVVGILPGPLTLTTALNEVDDIDFPFVIGQDQFIQNTADGLTENDLYADVAAALATLS